MVWASMSPSVTTMEDGTPAIESGRREADMTIRRDWMVTHQILPLTQLYRRDLFRRFRRGHAADNREEAIGAVTDNHRNACSVPSVVRRCCCHRQQSSPKGQLWNINLGHPCSNFTKLLSANTSSIKFPSVWKNHGVQVTSALVLYITDEKLNVDRLASKT